MKKEELKSCKFRDMDDYGYWICSRIIIEKISGDAPLALIANVSKRETKGPNQVVNHMICEKCPISAEICKNLRFGLVKIHHYGERLPDPIFDYTASILKGGPYLGITIEIIKSGCPTVNEEIHPSEAIKRCCSKSSSCEYYKPLGVTKLQIGFTQSEQ